MRSSPIERLATGSTSKLSGAGKNDTVNSPPLITRSRKGSLGASSGSSPTARAPGEQTALDAPLLEAPWVQDTLRDLGSLGAGRTSGESCDEGAIGLDQLSEKGDETSKGAIVQHPESGRPPRGPRILVVEDDAECRSAVKDALEECSFVVTEAGDGKVALDHMTSGLRPELVILDLQMPVMSGHELLQIMDGYQRLSRLPVLVISGTPARTLRAAEPSSDSWRSRSTWPSFWKP
jgi:CheY-like chemotaxis protein